MDIGNEKWKMYFKKNKNKNIFIMVSFEKLILTNK